MIFSQRNWISFSYHRNFDIIWKIAICLLFVTPVQLYPHQKNDDSQNVHKYSKQNAVDTNASKTLNSKITSANVKSDIEKPVFDNSNYDAERNIESAKSVTNDLEKSVLSETTYGQARQLNIPFMAMPSNWLATIQPSNALIITNKVPLRVWAIGSVSRFPAFLERILQRVQSYYSTYKYPDLSRPAALAIINPQYHQYDTSDNIPSSENDPTEDASTEDDSTVYDSIESDATESDLIENDTTEYDSVSQYDSTESDTVRNESIESTDTSSSEYYDATTNIPSSSSIDGSVERKCNGSMDT